MKPLNQIPWEEIHINDRVVSSLGTEGEIKGKNDVGHRDGPFVFIRWVNGTTSYQPHCLLDKVTWVGRP